MSDEDPYGVRRQVLRDWQDRGGPPRLLRWRVDHPGLSSAVIAVAWIGFMVGPAATTATRLDGWVGITVVAAIAVGAGWLAIRFLTATDVPRTRALLDAWDEVERGDLPPPEPGRWDADQVLVSGWRLTDGPGRFHRWVAADPRRYVLVASTVVLLPFAIAGIAIAVAGEGLSQRAQPLLWVPFGAIVVASVHGHARKVARAMSQWEQEQGDDSSSAN